MPVSHVNDGILEQLESMSNGYQCEQLENAHFVHLRISGLWNRENGSRILRELQETLKSSVHKKALFDFRQQEVETSVADEFELASLAAQLMGGRRHQIAAIAKEEDRWINDFFETVAVNRGLVIRIFTDEEKAIAWLLANGF